MRKLSYLMLLTCLAGCMSLMRTGPVEGTKAPPTQGQTADGRTMNIDEHRGKVVMLSFWHSACPPCRALFAHEKALVQRYASQPFVLLGVNSDQSQDDLRKTQQKAGLTWASWWDGGGAICEAWKVDRFPSLFLIDQHSVVRYRSVGVPPEGELEKHIDKLLRQPSS